MTSSKIPYQFRTMSVQHFPELQEDIDRLHRSDQLSHNPTFQSYIEDFSFHLSPTFPDAKFLIIVAIKTPPARIDCFYNNQVHSLRIPPQYYDDGIEKTEIETLIRTEILPTTSARLEEVTNLHLKLLAVRSGLGRYGRNNICYIDGFGSFHTLYAFFTDAQFAQDHWTQIQLAKSCEKCHLCQQLCPTHAISDDHFVLNVDRCVTLYNEIAGEFPEWMPAKAHNTLMGCLRCQEKCPMNQIGMKDFVSLESLTAFETEAILAENIPPAELTQICAKLKMFTPKTAEKKLPRIARNLRVLLH